MQQYHSMIIEDLIGFEENIDSFLSFHERNNNQMNDRDDDLIGADAPDQFHKDRYQKYHCYSDKNGIMESIGTKKPVALVYYKCTKELYCFIGKRRKKKLLQKMTLSNVEYNVKATMVFDLQCDNDPVSMEDVNVDLCQYISCMALPLTYCFGVEEGQSMRYVMRKKFYVVSEFHMKLSQNMSFIYSSLMGNERNQTDVPSHQRLFEGVSSLNVEEQRQCVSREWCVALIGSAVQPLQGTNRGEVVSFSYRGGHVTAHHATWKVKYYNNQRRNAVRVQMYSYWELKEILMQ